MDSSKEPWVITEESLHQNAHDILEYSNRLLRFKLEQNIASLVQSRLGPEVSAAASSAMYNKPDLDVPPDSSFWKEGLSKQVTNQSETCQLEDIFEEGGLDEPEPAPAGSDGSRASMDGDHEQFFGPDHSEDDDAEEVPRTAVDPAIRALREKAENGGGLSGCTTIMMRHVPFKYTQRKLVREINTTGFLGKYDFLYLPMDPRSHANRGFAFVNFVSSQVADAFYKTFHGKKLRHFSADGKEVAVLPADLQGFEQNAMRYAVTQMLRGKRTGHTKPIFLRQLPAACQHPQAFKADTEKPQQQSRASTAAEELHAKRQSMASALEAQQRRAEAWGYVTAMSAAKRRQDQRWVQEPQANAIGGIGLPHQQECVDRMALANIIKQNDTPAAHQQKNQAPSKEPMKMSSPHQVNFCRYCGNARIASHVFCPYCGSRVI